jgi:predicted nucleic acid-binding protein
VKKVVVDTTIYSHAMRGVTEAVGVLRKAETLLISPIVIGELLNSFKRGNRENRNREQLQKFLCTERIVHLSITADMPIPTNDIWIAASAMENGAALATMDDHFSGVDGLLIMPPG